MSIFSKNFDDKRIKKIIYTAVCVVLVGWFVFRFIMVAIESRMTVFNPVRDMNKNGTVVEYVSVQKQKGTIGIPISVKNNRAYVSGGVRAKLHVGQKLGDGTISYVSSNLDLDSGMYIVKTIGVADGINYAQINMDGYFVPVYAVRDGMVMVIDSDMAAVRTVTVMDQDADFACISDGIKDGDMVITSKVTNGQKINIQK